MEQLINKFLNLSAENQAKMVRYVEGFVDGLRAEKTDNTDNVLRKLFEKYQIKDVDLPVLEKVLRKVLNNDPE